MPEMKTVLKKTLPCQPLAAQDARRELERLRPELPEETLAQLRLAATELVGNSVRHGGQGQVELAVHLGQETVRLEVYDSGPGFAAEAHDPGPDSLGGRGLFIVEQLSHRWGVAAHDRVCVWAEFLRFPQACPA